MTDPYKILGIGYEAEDSEIKKAYHALARRYHPDGYADDPVRGELANRKMGEINAAYEQILADRARGVRGAAAYAAKEPPSHTKEPPSEGSRPRPAAPDESTGGKRKRKRGPVMPPSFVGYPRIRGIINEGGYAAALGELFRVPEKLRHAEWHYLAGLAHLGCRHLHDASTEILRACRLDKKNEEYQRARDELNRRMPSSGSERYSEQAGDTATASQKKRRPWIVRCLLRAFGLDSDR